MRAVPTDTRGRGVGECCVLSSIICCYIHFLFLRDIVSVFDFDRMSELFISRTHDLISRRIQVRENIAVTIRLLAGLFQITRYEFCYRRQTIGPLAYLAIFMGVSFSAHGPVFLRAILLLSKQARAHFWVTLISYRTLCWRTRFSWQTNDLILKRFFFIGPNVSAHDPFFATIFCLRVLLFNDLAVDRTLNATNQPSNFRVNITGI